MYHYIHLRKQTARKQIETERERESKKEGERGRNIDPPRLQLYIKWIKLIKVARTVCILSTSLKWEALKTRIQYLMNFHKKMKGKGSVPFRAGVPQQTEWEGETVGGVEFGRGLPKPRLLIGTGGHLIPGNQQLQIDS